MQIQRASVSSRCSTRARCFHQSAARPRAQIQTRFRKKAGREIRRDGQKKKQNERKKHTRWEHSSEWQYRGVCASSRRAILTQSYIYGLFSCKLPFWNRIGSILFFLLLLFYNKHFGRTFHGVIFIAYSLPGMWLYGSEAFHGK